MRNVLIGILIFALFGFTLFKSEDTQNEYIRIHIQSASISEKDEEMKFIVKEKVNSILSKLLVNVQSKNEVKRLLKERLHSIKKSIDTLLIESGANYLCEINLSNEYFPTRSYEGYVVESGFYDALTIKLGEGKGDNWWCVIYPPLCLLDDSGVFSSRLKGIIENFFNKKENGI